MNLNPTISNRQKPLKKEDEQSQVMSLFKKTSFSHFPVVKDDILLGLYSRSALEETKKGEELAQIDSKTLSHFFVNENYDVLEIMKEFAANKTNVLPVLNKDKKYIGYYDLMDLMKGLYDAPFLNSQGTVLIIQKNVDNYNFGEVCQIIESNKGKIYGVFVSKLRENKVEILIKFESHHINETIQLFRNYDYSVLSIHEEDTLLDEFEKRSDYLQKYLKM